MAAIDIPVPADQPTARLRWLGFLLLLFLGLVIAAIQGMRVDCRNNYLLSDIGQVLLSDHGQRFLVDDRPQCHLVAGIALIPLPSWAQAMFGL